MEGRRQGFRPAAGNAQEAFSEAVMRWRGASSRPRSRMFMIPYCYECQGGVGEAVKSWGSGGMRKAGASRTHLHVKIEKKGCNGHCNIVVTLCRTKRGRVGGCSVRRQT